MGGAAGNNLLQGMTHLVFHTYTHNPRAALRKGVSNTGPGILK